MPIKETIMHHLTSGLWIGGGMLLLFGVVVYVAGRRLCADVIEKEVASPDARYVATISERACGATTSFTTIVTLRVRRKSFNPDDDKRLLVLKGQSIVTMQWTSPESIELGYDQQDLFSKQTRWAEVAIIHQALPY